MGDEEFPYLSYNGGSGHGDTVTSIDSEAARDDIQRARQPEVFEYLKRAGAYGGTRIEIAAYLGVEPGSVSSALTLMLKSGIVHRTWEIRKACYVHIHPNFGPNDYPYEGQKLHLSTMEAVERMSLIADFLYDRGRAGKGKPGDDEVRRLMRYIVADSRKKIEVKQDREKERARKAAERRTSRTTNK